MLGAVEYSARGAVPLLELISEEVCSGWRCVW